MARRVRTRVIRRSTVSTRGGKRTIRTTTFDKSGKKTVTKRTVSSRKKSSGTKSAKTSKQLLSGTSKAKKELVKAKSKTSKSKKSTPLKQQTIQQLRLQEKRTDLSPLQKRRIREEIRQKIAFKKPQTRSFVPLSAALGKLDIDTSKRKASKTKKSRGKFFRPTLDRGFVTKSGKEVFVPSIPDAGKVIEVRFKDGKAITRTISKKDKKLRITPAQKKQREAVLKEFAKKAQKKRATKKKDSLQKSKDAFAKSEKLRKATKKTTASAKFKREAAIARIVQNKIKQIENWRNKYPSGKKLTSKQKGAKLEELLKITGGNREFINKINKDQLTLGFLRDRARRLLPLALKPPKDTRKTVPLSAALGKFKKR